MKRKLKIKDRSSLTPLESIGEHVYFGWVVLMFYSSMLFVSYQQLSSGQSKRILIGCMFASSVVGLTIRWGKHLTTLAVLADLVTGTGIYTILLFHRYFRGWIIGVLIAYVVIAFLFAGAIFRKRYRGRYLHQVEDRETRRFLIKSRSFLALHWLGLLLGLTVFIMSVPIGYQRLFHGGMLSAEPRHKNAESVDSDNDYGLYANLNSISKIRSDSTWAPLTVQEKLKVLQDICNCESKYWGMDFTVTVTMDNLENHVWGDYDDANRIVRVDQQHLEEDSAEEVLNTCLHEMYHAWEYCLVRFYMEASETQQKMRIFRQCEAYLEEMENYQKAEVGDHESFMNYYSQEMEEDSRRYAQNAVIEYYYEIDEYMKNDEASEDVSDGKE